MGWCLPAHSSCKERNGIPTVAQAAIPCASGLGNAQAGGESRTISVRMVKSGPRLPHKRPLPESAVSRDLLNQARLRA